VAKKQAVYKRQLQENIGRIDNKTWGISENLAFESLHVQISFSPLPAKSLNHMNFESWSLTKRVPYVNPVRRERLSLGQI